jgi:alpha-D-xyloside xylohydrolase
MTQSPFVLESPADERSGAIFFRSDDRRIRIDFFSNDVVRITVIGSHEFSSHKSHIVIGMRGEVKYALREDEESYTISSSALQIVLCKETGALRYCDTNGNLLMQEPERGGKWLTPKAVTRNIFSRDTAVELGQNIDGARASVAEYTTEFDRNAYEAKLEFVFSEDEALYGLGSHEEGYANLRGHSRELYQQNMKAVVPHLVSTRGYGILLDCSSAMTFHDDALGSYWWADCVDELDFYFIYGATFDGVIQRYRLLTGTTPLPPKWAFGYIQSKERYVTATEMVDVVAEYRRRRIPLDVIVLDWKSWPNGDGWGQKSLDPLRFPDPTGFTERLHAMGARLMVSVWPIMTGGCDDQVQLLERDLMLGNQSTYNAFLSEARDCYWQQAQHGLFRHGVDAWWCDCTEPFEADWAGAVKPEPHRRFEINTERSKLYLDSGEINAYSLMHSKGIYEGQRQTDPSKRVLNLTRSSYAGQHRYGTFTWNGDVCATWETLRRFIAEGVHFCATGEPYWTVDIGGFFIDNNPDLWFWRGDYRSGCRGLTEMNALAPEASDTGCSDLGFHELYTRWLQYAVFLPMFRSHGTDAAREIWRFGEEGSPFYDAIAAAIRLRYQLLPYIYSLVAGVTFDGSSMIRALGLAFPEDHATYAIGDQYLFGRSLMVCPVTKPMYYGPSSQPIETKEYSRKVYLPAGALWYDARTGAAYEGGQTIEVQAPLESIPWFLRAGAILPMTCVMQYVDEIPDAAYELRVYTGEDGEFILYEDAGDGYEYETGSFSRVRISWNQDRAELTFRGREGSFRGLIIEREYSVMFYAPGAQQAFAFRYMGSAYCIRLIDGKDPVRVDHDEI